ncbi:MAG: DNA repair protein RadC [Spirochaetales bacterium]|jgi:DNA repair protein RadC|nr:DNA repair protein RadC [Spirochaetales bacterium]MBQ2259338.1 DNA repair protein RadC [Spirochaetales bacterium]
MNENETTKEIYEEQPREKLGRLGPEALTDKELITLIIGSGGGGRKAEDIAEELLSYLDKNPNTRLNELRYIPGMGAAKASAIIAAMELGRRKITQKPRTINCPMDIYKEVLHYSSRDKEHFITIALNGAHEVIDSFISTIGLINRTLIHPREVFAPAIEMRAAAIAIAHNHPSGHLEPSAEDKAATDRLVEAGKILGIKVLDHLVFSTKGYYSFLEHSLI